ncbi:RDD family protein [Noviherbaspirillum album]|uniref:RDD family protein n=1 Tax=Noviherbaspirillum album TaxID=3080276 RepID=UPI00345FBD48
MRLVVYIPGAWLYFAAMESSPMQATLGKKAFGIMVVGERETRITFNRAFLRLGQR